MVDKDSILATIKKLLNIDEEDTAFDTDITVLINGEFMGLQQLGIGPEEGYSINGYTNCWSDYCSDQRIVEAVKTYIYLRVRMVFDPPASSVVADAYQQKISEMVWRLNVWAEQMAGGENQ